MARDNVIQFPPPIVDLERLAADVGLLRRDGETDADLRLRLIGGLRAPNHREDVIAKLSDLPGVDRVWVLRNAAGDGLDVYVPGYTGDDETITRWIFYVSDGVVAVFRTPPPGVSDQPGTSVP